jgi:hypothetical protein
MKTPRSLFGSLLVASVVLVAGQAVAADLKKPDCTVAINETDFALILGGTFGGGKLTCKGKAHDFKIGGLTVGANVGVTKIKAKGEVYDLKDVSKFPGAYAKFDMAGAAGGGGGILYLKNEHGVVMKLESEGKGLQLNVGSASGVVVKME